MHTAEKVFVDLLAIRPWNKHGCGVVCDGSTGCGGLLDVAAVILEVAVRDPQTLGIYLCLDAWGRYCPRKHHAFLNY